MRKLNLVTGCGTRPSSYNDGGYWEIGQKDTEEICDILENFLSRVLTEQSFNSVWDQRPEDPMDFNAPERLLDVLWKAMNDIAPAGTVFGIFRDRDYLGFWPPDQVR
jgi:hypothetical protein